MSEITEKTRVPLSLVIGLGVLLAGGSAGVAMIKSDLAAARAAEEHHEQVLQQIQRDVAGWQLETQVNERRLQQLEKDVDELSKGH